jgi:hypothetical protein
LSLRRSAPLALAALSLLVLTACNGAEQPDDTAQPSDELPEELGDLEDGELDLDEMFGDQDLPDPNEFVDDDGVFRGEGIVLPIPAGFELEPMAFMQGLIAAVTEDGRHQVAAQAVDTATIPEPLDIDGLAEANAEQFGEPVTDEETEVDGATRARQMRFEGVPSGQEDTPELTLVLVIAEDGDGEIAIFNYVSPTEDFDEDDAELVLAGIGFDPDSSPPDPEPAPQAP